MFKGHVAEGMVTGTGAAITIQTGWIPSYVVLTNETSRDQLWYHSNMTAGYGVKRVAAGTATLITTGGVTPYAGSAGANAAGFTIGTDTDINVSGEILHYYAVSTDA
jgi:hypothetical protein